MGVVRLRQRSIPGVTGARVTPGTSQVELSTREAGYPAAGLQGQAATAPNHVRQPHRAVCQRGAPPKVLALPLKDRMSTLITFGVFFPLGTISIFSGVLLAIRGLG